MNEMYNMSIITHDIGVIGILGVILVNILMLLQAQNIHVYAKKMRVFMPIGATMIGTILFTGAVMMAAKHLEFSVENIIMIIFGTFLIFFETRRYSNLKHLDIRQEDALQTYKKKASVFLFIELIGSLAISVWMWI